jgi:hypothetical protein
VVPGGKGGGIPGSCGWTGLAFAFFPGRGLAIQNHAPSLAQSQAPRVHGLAKAPGMILVLGRRICLNQSLAPDQPLTSGNASPTENTTQPLPC